MLLKGFVNSQETEEGAILLQILVLNPRNDLHQVGR